MKTKWQLVLCVGLVLLLTSSVVGCAKEPEPATTSETTPSPTQTPPSAPTQQLYNLIISIIPQEAGEVVAYPKYGYEPESQVRLTSVSAIGYTFDRWEGDISGSTNPITITMDSDKNIIAHFNSEPVFGVVYPVRTTGKYGYVSHIGFTLFNDSSETITIEEVRVIDYTGHIAVEISDEQRYRYDWVSIADIWGNRRINPNRSLSASIGLFETLREYTSDHISVEWFCVDTDGVPFKVSAIYWVEP